jgi:hypothetical protein
MATVIMMAAGITITTVDTTSATIAAIADA